MTTATKTGNPVERIKDEKPGLDILDEIHELAAQHGGWETIEPGDRERLKWIGTFFRKPTPGRFMMRLRVTNGRLTAPQLACLAHLSRKLGSGVMDLTTRQQIELRDIRIRDVPEILDALRDVDLSSLQTGMDNIRGANTCALSGVTPNELFDAAPASEEFTRIFLGNQEYTNLPRKLNVAFTGCLENCIHAETQDIAMTPATGPDGVPGFNVAVGGKMGSGGMTIAQPLDVFAQPEDAARLAAAITLLFRDEGSREKRTRARLAFLLDDWGVEKFRERLEERWGTVLLPAGRDVRRGNHADHLGVTPQRQEGLYSVGLCVPTGRTCADDMSELARLAAAYGSGAIRLTVGQSAIIANVPEANLPALLAEPLLSRLSPEASPFARGLVSCTGNDYCNLGLIETKSVSQRVAAALDACYPHTLAKSGTPLRMYWSGCPAGCGNHHAADIGFQGGKTRFEGEVVDAVTIFAGGRTGPNARPAEKLMEQVPVSTLGDVLTEIIEKLNASGFTGMDSISMPSAPGVDYEA